MVSPHRRAGIKQCRQPLNGADRSSHPALRPTRRSKPQPRTNRQPYHRGSNGLQDSRGLQPPSAVGGSCACRWCSDQPLNPPPSNRGLQRPVRLILEQNAAQQIGEPATIIDLVGQRDVPEPAPYVIETQHDRCHSATNRNSRNVLSWYGIGLPRWSERKSLLRHVVAICPIRWDARDGQLDDVRLA